MPDCRGRVARLLWGTAYANAVDFGYPWDGVLTDSRDREGSEAVQLVSGVEDASQAGRDFYLAATARWVPAEDTLASGSVKRATGWNGTAGLDAALHWGRGKRLLVVCPDTRNLLRSPSLDVAQPSTVWPTGGTATSRVYTNDDDGTKLTAASTPGSQSAYVVQRVPGILAGEALTLSVASRTASVSGTVTFSAAIEYYDASDAYLGATTAAVASGGSWARTTTATGTAPANTSYVNVTLYALLTSAGSSAEVWWRDAVLARRASDAASFVDNPEWSAYLVPSDPPTLERDASRRVPLTFRSTSAITGY